MVGLVLILVASVLLLIALMVSFRILPVFGGGGAGYTASIGGSATRDIPPTAPRIRNAMLAFLGTMGMTLMAVGLWLTVQDTTHSWQVQDAIRTNQERLAMLSARPVTAATVAGTPASTPISSATSVGVATQPSPQGTPMPLAGAAREAFHEAVALDAAGENTAAIAKYKLALAGDLDVATAEAARLEVGLLSLVEVQAGDMSACPDARSNLQLLASSATDAETKQLASDALRQAVKLCA